MSLDLPPRCARCVNFDPTSEMDMRGCRNGVCRAEPPRCDPAGGGWATFPRVLSSDWCGRFVQRERRRAAA